MEKTALSLPQVTADLYRTAAPAETLITVLLPVPADLSRLPVYKKDRAALLALTGLDWDALPPWPAPPLRPGDAPFTGGAAKFLAALTETILPEAERAAGLAACAALSGSFWYDGFTDWLRTHPARVPRVYLGLGRKEKDARHPRLAAIERATDETAAILRGAGVSVTAERFPGGHRTTPDRLARAVRWLLDGQ